MSRRDEDKKRIYEVVEASHEGDRVSKAYDIMMFVAVIVGMIPLTIKGDNQFTKVIDLFTVILFIGDYGLRLYTSDYKMGIKSYKAYLAYAFTPMAIVDLLSIVPILCFVMPTSKTIALFRVFRVFRLLKLVRYSKVMHTIVNVLRRVKKQLGAVLILAVGYIIAVALIMFTVEPDVFPNFFDAVYWATVSITTIGYGDYAPVTAIGKFITVLSALVGTAVIALPTGIITAAYTDEIKRKKSKLEL